MVLLSKIFRREPTRDRFAKLVIRRFAKAGMRDLEYRESDFSIQRPGTANAVFLFNVYQNYCQADPQGRTTLLNRFVNAFAADSKIPTDLASAQKTFMPVLRDFRYISLSRLALESRGTTEVHLTPELAFAPELSVLCACDFQDSISLVNQDKLDAWGITLEDAVVIAKENLRDRTAPSGFTRLNNGVFLGSWNDSYESARLILPDYFYRLPLQGDPVAFIPNRDILFVCGELDRAGLKFMVEEGAKTHFENGYPLSPSLYVLREGHWEKFIPQDTYLQKQVLDLQKRRAAMDYAEQEKYLAAIFEREGKDIFVAACQLFREDDGGHFTHCVWTKDIDSLLPLTDEVTLLFDAGSSEGETRANIRLPWSEAQTHLAEWMEPVKGLIPGRVRVRRFPEGALLEKLRQLPGS